MIDNVFNLRPSRSILRAANHAANRALDDELEQEKVDHHLAMVQRMRDALAMKAAAKKALVEKAPKPVFPPTPPRFTCADCGASSLYEWRGRDDKCFCGACVVKPENMACEEL